VLTTAYASQYFNLRQVDAIPLFSLITAPPGSVSGIRYSSLAIWGHRRGAQIARPIPKYQSALARLLSRILNLVVYQYVILIADSFLELS